MNKVINKKEKCHLMAKHLPNIRGPSQDINLRIINYINFVVIGCRKRPGHLMVWRSPDERGSSRTSGFDSQPGCLQFPVGEEE